MMSCILEFVGILGWFGKSEFQLDSCFSEHKRNSEYESNAPEWTLIPGLICSSRVVSRLDLMLKARAEIVKHGEWQGSVQLAKGVSKI